MHGHRGGGPSSVFPPKASIWYGTLDCLCQFVLSCKHWGSWSNNRAPSLRRSFLGNLIGIPVGEPNRNIWMCWKKWNPYPEQSVCPCWHILVFMGSLWLKTLSFSALGEQMLSSGCLVHSRFLTSFRWGTPTSILLCWEKRSVSRGAGRSPPPPARELHLALLLWRTPGHANSTLQSLALHENSKELCRHMVSLGLVSDTIF